MVIKIFWLQDEADKGSSASHMLSDSDSKDSVSNSNINLKRKKQKNGNKMLRYSIICFNCVIYII